ncbi:hypothetical protein E2562_010859 [Oryza meyeriana var. granulata]|uniref:Uncharacterized protein n=1 Tax=Oryza meyeriana var. granulata TaxID=110450 RepID=A0A6G1BJE2_9ORYZ|nr:hypothetical protein E2562_010859 [Oryza meyeriana var. granulata]
MAPFISFSIDIGANSLPINHATTPDQPDSLYVMALAPNLHNSHGWFEELKCRDPRDMTPYWCSLPLPATSSPTH